MKNDYLLIKEIEQKETVTESGLIIPPPKHNRLAKVINSGDIEFLKDGDSVIKELGKGTMVKLNGEQFEVIHKNQLIAIIGDNNAETTS